MKLKKIIAAVCAVSVFMLSAVSVSAASNFTPSVTKKNSVTVVSAVDSKGNPVDIIVTPFSRVEDAPTPDCKRQLYKAFDEINSAASLDKLSFDGKNPYSKDTTDVVANLFDVYCTNPNVFDGGNTITVTFNVSDLSSDVASIWIHRDSKTEKWNAMDVKKSGTNNYTTTFSSLSPVAISVPTSGNGAVSPQTGDNSYILYIVTITGVIAFAGAAVFAGKKFVTAE